MHCRLFTSTLNPLDTSGLLLTREPPPHVGQPKIQPSPKPAENHCCQASIMCSYSCYSQAIHRLQSWKADQEITWSSPPSLRQGRCCSLHSTNKVKWWRWRGRSNWDLLRFAPSYLFMGVGLGCLAFWSFPSMLLRPSSSVDKICSHRNLGWQDFSNPSYLRKEKMLRMT